MSSSKTLADTLTHVVADEEGNVTLRGKCKAKDFKQFSHSQGDTTKWE